MVALLNLTAAELVIVAVIGAAMLLVPVVVVIALLRAFNEHQTQRRSEVVDQALTRDAEIAPLPPADDPAGKPRQ
jgi:uncharacterized membrane protein HdeD (DUF308 family)